MKVYQPFPAEKKRYFVSQSYPRGEIRKWGEEPKIPLVFSLYENKGLAQVHLSAVKGDKYAALIDLENEARTEKITAMMQPDSKYEVFISMVWKNDENDRFIKKHTPAILSALRQARIGTFPKPIPSTSNSKSFSVSHILPSNGETMSWRYDSKILKEHNDVLS